MAPPLVHLASVTKDYRGLRPLRIAGLELHDGQTIALMGLDSVMSEVLVNLITGAMLPDSGEVIVFGQPTRDITDPEAWVRTLDRFGLLSERAVFLEQMTAEQNLAVPFSLELEELPADVRTRVRTLADEVGLDAHSLRQPVAALPPVMKLRVRLGRALAMDPRVLLAEHPNAALPRDDVPVFATDLSRVLGRRRIAAVIVTADATFARAVAQQVLTLQPATGELERAAGWRRWLFK
jgi:ABC-type methionine transport system ATPase subunit